MPSPTPPSVTVVDARCVRLAGALLVLAIIAAYLTSFRGVMVFDDHYAIVDNPLIRDLGRLDRVLLPPPEGGPIAGRPVVNLTLALNHAAGGIAPAGYHAVNLLIHLLAGLALFGVMRRTLLRLPALSADSVPLALAVASLWALHPLQTESVTYIIQRAESLCGLFYVLTLYCFVRALSPVGGADPAVGPSGYKTPPTQKHSRGWFILSFVACLFGMATKEVMATAPLVVLLYDRVFVGGSWRETWRQRRGIHLALAGTWLLLGALVLSAENRGGSAGLGTGVAPWSYALTQCEALVHYLRLTLWPDPLVFDYGTTLVGSITAVVPQGLGLLLLLGGTVWALAKKPALGFLGACFFLILAPSSSFVPVATQTMAEHRMYLPLAPVMVLFALGLRSLVGSSRGLIVCFGLALACAGLTAARNCVYESELTLWSDTVAHRPQNARAHSNLGIALVEAGRSAEAINHFAEAVRLEPRNAAAHLNLCDTLVSLDRAGEALAPGEAAVEIEPRSAGAHAALARALAALGRTGEAISHYEEARRLQPAAHIAAGLAAAYQKLGNESASRGDFRAAITHYQQALSVDPDYVPARANLGNALLVSGRMEEAIAAYREVLRQNPGDARTQENLARALDMQRANVR
jgi:tetratricopeptide (TPR) repeat protein